MSGPPESPWQESFPESAAQIMLAVMLPYALLHSVFVVTVTSTSCRAVGWLPPLLRVPQPVTVASTPAYVAPVSAGRQAGATSLVKVTACERRRMA